MDQSTTIISNNIELLLEVRDNIPNWIHNSTARDQAIDLLNGMDIMTYGKFWLTEEEEFLLDYISNTIEAYSL
jgi:hypothetical protein